MRFPTGLAADIEGHLVVSDSANHRVLVGHTVGRSYAVQQVFGVGEPGFADGSIERARFNMPHGLALSGDMLIVADRGNHAIRLVDLATGEVATMAGTGSMAMSPVESGDPLEIRLRSPWDVALHHDELFIAMSDAERIWRLDLKAGSLTPHGMAGTGAERAGDERRAAQPMALAIDEEALYLADAETSCVRRVPFDAAGTAETLVGTTAAEGGDVDGAVEAARLRHPSALAWGQGNHRFWVADTDNHKLKLLDPIERRVDTVEPFEAELEKPQGLAAAGHMMYVADTNHHRILRVDQIDKRVTQLAVEGA